MTNDCQYNTLDFRIARTTPYQRGGYRVAVRGLSFHFDELAQAFDIRDISAGGCSLNAPVALFTIDRIFDGDLHIGNTSYITHLKMKVVRHIADNCVACAFQVLSCLQGILLDKLVLEVQKRNIVAHTARRKREEEKCRHMLR